MNTVKIDQDVWNKKRA